MTTKQEAQEQITKLETDLARLKEIVTRPEESEIVTSIKTLLGKSSWYGIKIKVKELPTSIYQQKQEYEILFDRNSLGEGFYINATLVEICETHKIKVVAIEYKPNSIILKLR